MVRAVVTPFLRLLVPALIGAALVASSTLRAGAQTPPVRAGEGLGAQTYRLQIETLLKLPEAPPPAQAVSPADLKAVAARCVEQLGKQTSYSSFARLLDRSIPALASRMYVAQSWTFDHQEPDRYRVTQSLWNGAAAYYYDEWITIGKTHFDFAGLWLEHGNPVRVDLNPRLGLQKYLQVLRNVEPRSGGTQMQDGKSYTTLTYMVPLAGDFKTFFAGSEGSAQVQLWLDPESDLLVGARVTPASTQAPVRELQQAFAGYGGDVQIRAPQTESAGK